MKLLLEDFEPLQDMARTLARLDVLCAFAERAERLKLVRPDMSGRECASTSAAAAIPVVEQVQDQPFTPNDIRLDAETRMLIITGPNMGGKSTYMRQTALIILLAHAGSWVPANPP